LNPLSDEANLVAGNIALRLGDLRRAERQFTQALKRSPHDAYATLILGAIASAEGHRSAALRLLATATRLNPRDPVARSALGRVASGGHVSVQELGLSVLAKAREFR
jgi:Flp pilus assembly protein TadD